MSGDTLTLTIHADDTGIQAVAKVLGRLESAVGKASRLQSTFSGLDVKMKELRNSSLSLDLEFKKLNTSFEKSRDLSTSLADRKKKLATTTDRLLLANIKLLAKEKDLNVEETNLLISSAKLASNNKLLAAENEKLAGTNRKLAASSESLSSTDSKRVAANIKLISSNEKQIQANNKLISANNSLAISSDRKVTATNKQTRSNQTLILSGGKVTTAAKKETTQTNSLTSAKDKVNKSTRTQIGLQKSLQSAMRGTAGALGGLWLSYGRIIPMMAAFAEVSGVKAVLTSGSEFEYQMRFIETVSGRTVDEIDKVSDSLLEMARTSVFAPNELAKGLRILTQSGIDPVVQGLETLISVQDLAILGEISMADAATTLQTVMHSYGLSVSAIPHVVDSIAKTSFIAATNVREMSAALTNAAQIGARYGVSIDETNAMLAVLAKRHLVGAKAGTALTNMMREMSPRSEAAARAYEKLGIEIYDSEGRMRSVIDLFSEMSDSMSKYTEESQNTIAGILHNLRGVKAFLGIVAEGNDGLIKSYITVMRSAGTAEDAVHSLRDTVSGDMSMIKSNIEDGLIRAFQDSSVEIKSLSSALREAFASDTFRNFISDVTSGTVSLIKYTKEHKEVIIDLATAYVRLKVAMKATTMIIGGASAGLSVYKKTLDFLAKGLFVTTTAAAGTSANLAVLGSTALVSSSSVKKLNRSLLKLKARNLILLGLATAMALVATKTLTTEDGLTGLKDAASDTVDVFGDLIDVDIAGWAASAWDWVPGVGELLDKFNMKVALLSDAVRINRISELKTTLSDPSVSEVSGVDLETAYYDQSKARKIAADRVSSMKAELAALEATGSRVKELSDVKEARATAASNKKRIADQAEYDNLSLSLKRSADQRKQEVELDTLTKSELLSEAGRLRELGRIDQYNKEKLSIQTSFDNKMEEKRKEFNDLMKLGVGSDKQNDIAKENLRLSLESLEAQKKAKLELLAIDEEKYGTEEYDKGVGLLEEQIIAYQKLIVSAGYLKKEADELARIQSAYAKLTLAALPKEERAIESVTRKYKALRDELTEVAFARNMELDEYEALMDAYDAREQEALDGLKDKAAETIEINEETADEVDVIWDHAFDSLADSMTDWIKSGEVDLDSLANYFEDSVARMVSTWLVGQAKMIFTGGDQSPESAKSGAYAGMYAQASGGSDLGLMSAGVAAWNEYKKPGSYSDLMLKTQNNTASTLEALGFGTAGDYAATGLTSKASLSFNFGSGGDLGNGAAGSVSGASPSSFNAGYAGISTFVVSLLQGKDFDQAAAEGVGAWGGAEYGAYIGSKIDTVWGTIIGSILGATLGAFGVGSLFAPSENEFTLNELDKYIDDTYSRGEGFNEMAYYRESYTVTRVPGTTDQFIRTPDVPTEFYTDFEDGIRPDATYKTIIDEIQTSASDYISTLAETMSVDVQDVFYTALEGEDFAVDSDGRWKISNTAYALTEIAENYATKIDDNINSALLATLPLITDGILGENSSYTILTTAMQDKINSIVHGGDFGEDQFNELGSYLTAIAQATAPITEIMATKDLSEYELQLRTINQQFDDYGAQLESVGIDLEKYTEFEIAKTNALDEALAQMQGPALDAIAGVREELTILGMSETEQSIYAINKEFDALIVTLTDAKMSADALSDAEELRTSKLNSIAAATAATAAATAAATLISDRSETLGNAKLALTTATDDLNAAELALSNAEKTINNSLDAELARLHDVSDTQIQVLQDQLDSVSSSLSDLTGYANSLHGAVQGMDLGTTAFAQDQFANASGMLNYVLESTRAGDFSMLGQLDDVLSVLQSPDKGTYANFDDYQRDYWKTYSALSEIENLTDTQVDAQQAMVDSLEYQIEAQDLWYDEQAALLQSQVDAVYGVSNDIIGLGAALASYASSQQAVAAAQAASLAAKAEVDIASASSDRATADYNYYSQDTIRAFFDDKLLNGVLTAQGIIDYANEYNASVYAIGNAYDLSPDEVDAYFHKEGIPGYATGGIHEGGWRIVGEHGPELENTQPSHIYSNQQSKSLVDFSEVVAELREVKKELRQIKAQNVQTKTYTKETSELLDKFDAIGLGARA